MESQSGLGSMIQIKAQGPQNVYVNGCPSMTPFISIYKRYFDFAKYVKVENLDTDFGKTIIYRIEPDAHGDLLSDIVFSAELERLPNPNTGTLTPNCWYIDNIGQALLEKIELKIGEVTVDTITSEWLQMYDNIYLSDSQYEAIKFVTGQGEPPNTLGPDGITSLERLFLYVPLRLFFERKKTDMLPLCALPHQTIQLIIHLRESYELVHTYPLSATTPGNVWGGPIVNKDNRVVELDNPRFIFTEYIIDDNLRRYFKNNKLSYLVKATKPAPAATFESSATNFSDTNKFKYYPDTNATISLLTWALRSNVATSANTVVGTGNDYFNYSNTMIRTGVFMNDRWVDELQIGDREYWRYIQPLMYLPAAPRSEIYNWSLGIKNDPTISQEWGGIDFSRIRGRQFFFEIEASEINLELLMFMTTTNYMEIENGVITSYFIY